MLITQGCFEHIFIQLPSLQFPGLEIIRPGIGSQGEQDGEFVLKTEKGLYGVPAHIGGYGDRIKIHIFEEGLCISRGRIADIPSFGIGYGQYLRMIFIEVGDGLRKGFPSLKPVCLIKGGIGFVGYAEMVGGIYDGFVEGKNWVGLLQQVGRDLLEIRIQADTQKGFFCFDLFYKSLYFHELSESFGGLLEFFRVLYQHQLIDDLLNVPIHDILQVV